MVRLNHWSCEAPLRRPQAAHLVSCLSAATEDKTALSHFPGQRSSSWVLLCLQQTPDMTLNYLERLTESILACPVSYKWEEARMNLISSPCVLWAQMAHGVPCYIPSSDLPCLSPGMSFPVWRVCCADMWAQPREWHTELLDTRD